MGGRYVDHILYEGLANENAEKLNSEGWESSLHECEISVRGSYKGMGI